MIYVCNICKFLFERLGPVESCPDCGKLLIREASKAEKEEYLKNGANANDRGSKEQN